MRITFVRVDCEVCELAVELSDRSEEQLPRTKLKHKPTTNSNEKMNAQWGSFLETLAIKG
jgi:hypothetical protein